MGTSTLQSKRLPAQLLVRAHARVAGSVPSQGTCNRQPVLVSLSHCCFSPSLSTSLPLSLKTNKLSHFKKKRSWDGDHCPLLSPGCTPWVTEHTKNPSSCVCSDGRPPPECPFYIHLPPQCSPGRILSLLTLSPGEPPTPAPGNQLPSKLHWHSVQKTEITLPHTRLYSLWSPSPASLGIPPNRNYLILFPYL